MGDQLKKKIVFHHEINVVENFFLFFFMITIEINMETKK
jgi:hypothetical protein